MSMNNALTLTNGTDSIKFTVRRIARGTVVAQYINTRGEKDRVSLYEGRDRIRMLLSAGWKFS